MFKNNIAKLRERRGKCGVSQGTLALRLKVSRGYLSRLENGKRKPNAEIMYKLAWYFECPIEDIFEYIPEN